MSLPLVSCVMPTKGFVGPNASLVRREFVEVAVEYFLRQSYSNKELVIVADEPWPSCPSEYETPDRVRWLRGPAGVTLGAKRNWCVEHARGDLIAHWDDDDWYGPERLQMQVQAMQLSHSEVCGIDAPVFYDLITGTAFQYHCRARVGYLYSPTLMFTREYWARSPFPDVQVGAGTPFVCGPGRLDKAYFVRDGNWYAGIGHLGNNSRKPFKAFEFTRWDGDMESRLGADWPFYQGLRERMGVAA